MRTLLKVGLRVFSILTFLNLIEVTLINIGTYTSMNFGNNAPGIVSLSIMFLLVTAVLLIIWIKADWLVGVIAGKVDDQVLSIKASSSEITSIILRSLGIYFILRAIPQIAGQITYQVTANSHSSGFGYSLTPSDYRNWAVQLLTFAIGLALVVGAGRMKKAGAALGNFWKYGNSSGPESEPPVEDRPVS